MYFNNFKFAAASLNIIFSWLPYPEQQCMPYYQSGKFSCTNLYKTILTTLMTYLFYNFVFGIKGRGTGRCRY